MALKRSHVIIGLLVCAAALWFVAGRPLTGAAATAPSIEGVAAVEGGEESASDPLLLACAGVLAVSGLLVGMTGLFGRIIVLSLSGVVGVFVVALSGAAFTADGATGWPLAGIAVGLAAGFLSGFGAAASTSWTTSSRYSRDAADDEDEDPVSAWDALSRGEDPT